MCLSAKCDNETAVKTKGIKLAAYEEPDVQTESSFEFGTK